MNKKRSLVLLFICFSLSLLSQTSIYRYARHIVDTLASESMHGRGYVNNGDKIAANFIRSEFKRFGIKELSSGYYQKFHFPINTFPGKMFVAIDGKELTAGKDYIISERSGSGKGTFQLKRYATGPDGYVIVQKEKVKYAALINGWKNPVMNSPGSPLIYLTTEKLTHDLEWNHFNFPAVKIIDSVIPPNAQTITLDIQNKFIKKYESQNVIGYIEGAVHSDSFIIFSAHYDHLGQMGNKIYFPGANDNASGCAMLLSLAKHYSLPENKPKYSIVFIAFGGEEAGLIGSKFYTEHPLVPLERTKFVFNMDIMGTGEDGITVVNGAIYKNEFEKLKEINTKNNLIKDVKPRGKAANSDHFFFSEKGVKAFFIYTMGGIKAYHDIYDKPETLPLNEFEDLLQLITQFGSYLQE